MKSYRKQMKLCLMQYRTMREQSRKEAILRHEFKNQMHTVLSLLETGKYDTAISMLKDMAEVSPAGYEFCANEIINVILCRISEKCQKKGIALDVSVNIPEKLAMSARDTCSLFMNLLDNAVEACLASGQKKPVIKLNGGIRSDMLVLHLVNSKAETAHPKVSMWRSTKPDAEQHGYGMRIIRSILSRYDGDIIAEDKGTVMDIVVCVGEWKVG